MARRRSSTTALARLLGAAPMPVYVVDQDRRIVFANDACADWLGVERSELEGMQGHYCSAETDLAGQRYADLLCPPPEAFVGQVPRMRIADPHAPGRGCAVELVALGRDQACVGVLAIVTMAGDTGADGSLLELEGHQLHERLQSLVSTLRRHWVSDHLIGESDAIRRVREQVCLASQTSPRVVVVGPPGSGREHVARKVHYGDDPSSSGPLVPLSCRLLDAELMQTTITALVRRCQDLPPSRTGALLLLDVDELSEAAQMELAGFLTLPDFKLHTISTARQGLASLMGQGRMRSDLAMLLSTMVIEIPSLRERREDIPLLAQHFLERSNRESPRQLSGFTAEALDALVEYEWPRNLDELSEYVAAAAERAAGTWIGVEELPDRIHLAAQAARRPPRNGQRIVLDEVLEETERKLIQEALAVARGNKAKAARLLSISRPRLLRRIQQLGL